MGVVIDAQQGPSPCDVKGTEQSKIQMPTDLVETRKENQEHSVEDGLSPSSSTGAEQSESSASSSAATPAPAPPQKRAFSVSPVVRMGGVALGCCAGAVNAVAFMAIGSFVSHQTGSFSKVGLGDMDALLLVTSFVGGALICGLLVSHNIIPMRVQLYDVCLIIQAGLLVATTLLSDHWVARYIAAAACGLQNGLATHWGGAVLRTTHVTGLFTDVGLLLGRLLAMVVNKCGKQSEAFDSVAAADDLNKLSVLGSIAMSYLVGIILGTHSFDAIGHYAFLIPAAAVGLVGCVYLCYRVFSLCFSSDEGSVEPRLSRRLSWQLGRQTEEKNPGRPVMTRCCSSVV